MNCIFFAVITFASFLRSHCQQCPPIYLRYSKDHSYCKPKNPTCPIYHSGLTDAERRQIVFLHNKYRSFIATGKETNAGGMPTAADMLQMVWDKELAAVAQKRAEQCIYAHDCFDCRRVENFDVGQNIAYQDLECFGTGECNIHLSSAPDWPYVIKMFYDEVEIFDKKYMNSIVFLPGKEYGHFTQMVWAKTWRIGCGFVAFVKGNGYRHFYVCNYGPSGNILNTPMYNSGAPCKACPINSCCGNSCARPTHEGLCRMNNYNDVPVYRMEENYIFHCDFNSHDGDCSNSVDGINKWKYIKALGGSYAEVVLNGGEISTLILKKIIRPKQNFCLIVMYRTGPTVDGHQSSNTAVVNFKMPNARPTLVTLPSFPSKQFINQSIDLSWSYDTKVSFTFSVPNGIPEQFLNIQLVAAKSGKCR